MKRVLLYKIALNNQVKEVLRCHLFYKLLGIFFCCHLFTTTACAQNQLSHHISKSFTVGNNPTFIAESKYGNIDCKVWYNDSIKITADIFVSGKNNEDLLEVLKSIVPQFSVYNNIVTVKTEIVEAKENFIKSFFSSIDFLSNKEISINYTIWAPQDCNLEISNKFGDVLLDNFKGNTKINLKYGDFRAQSLIGESTLDLRYGKLNVKSIQAANIILKHFDGKINKAEKLTLNSNASELRFGSIKHLSVSSSKDEIKIDKLGLLNGTVKLSEIEIKLLEHSLQLKIDNADLEIESIQPSFSNIDIQQKGTYVNMNVNGLSFDLNANLDDTEMIVPNSIYGIKKQIVNEKKNQRTVSLKFGSSPDKLIKFQGKNGTFDLWD